MVCGVDVIRDIGLVETEGSSSRGCTLLLQVSLIDCCAFSISAQTWSSVSAYEWYERLQMIICEPSWIKWVFKHDHWALMKWYECSQMIISAYTFSMSAQTLSLSPYEWYERSGLEVGVSENEGFFTHRFPIIVLSNNTDTFCYSLIKNYFNS